MPQKTRVSARNHPVSGGSDFRRASSGNLTQVPADEHTNTTDVELQTPSAVPGYPNPVDSRPGQKDLEEAEHGTAGQV